VDGGLCILKSEPREMSVTASFSFVQSPNEKSEILNWFRALPHPPEETARPRGVVLYFRRLGVLALNENGGVDGTRSPIVDVVLPKVRRGILWTVGKVDFLPMPVSVFRPLAKIRREFARWIESYPLVHSTESTAETDFSYYLEGSALNRGEIYGMPSGLVALRAGQYFVDDTDNDTRLETVCRTLRLRGLECSPI